MLEIENILISKNEEKIYGGFLFQADGIEGATIVDTVVIFTNSNLPNSTVHMYHHQIT
jgi:hypothetical protein